MDNKPVELALFKRIKQFRDEACSKGWTVKIHDPNATHEHRVFVMDYASSKLCMGSVSSEMMEGMVDNVAMFDQQERSYLGDAAGDVIDQFAKGKVTSVDDVVTLSAMFFLTTQTCELIRQPDYQHPVPESKYLLMIIRYPGDGISHHVRPFSLATNSKSLPSPDEVRGFFNHAETLDRQVHPEFFGSSAEVLPFNRQQ